MSPQLKFLALLLLAGAALATFNAARGGEAYAGAPAGIVGMHRG